MYTLLIVFYVLVSVALVGLVLIQQGKGADAGAAFGSGASGTVFGSRGSANFLSRATAWLATVFFLLSLALAYVVHGRSEARSVVDDAPAATAPAAPATLATPAPVTPSASADQPKTPVSDNAKTAQPATDAKPPAVPAPKTP
ncbi:MAG: secG [Nevskia sp.]|nr:secG [Nevskia sp.]